MRITRGDSVVIIYYNYNNHYSYYRLDDVLCLTGRTRKDILAHDQDEGFIDYDGNNITYGQEIEDCCLPWRTVEKIVQ